MALTPVPPEALTWLRQLAHARDFDGGWDPGEPYSTWEEYLAIGLIEYRPAAFRLSDIGWWVLDRLVVDGEET